LLFYAPTPDPMFLVSHVWPYIYPECQLLCFFRVFSDIRWVEFHRIYFFIFDVENILNLLSLWIVIAIMTELPVKRPICNICIFLIVYPYFSLVRCLQFYLVTDRFVTS